MADIVAIREYTRELVMATFEKRSPEPLPDGINVSDIIEVAAKGHMPYLLLNPLLKVTADSKEVEIIKKSVMFSTLKTFHQVMAAKQITEAFEKNGIKHQILKGTIMKNIYPSPEMREMSDVDLVVYDESLDKAAKIMEELGYKNEGLVKHHMIFTKDGVLCVEVHWCLIDKSVDYKQYLHFKDNFNARLKEGYSYTYEFSIEDFYVYMIAHMSKHFFETGCGIRNLVDIYVYQKKYSDIMDAKYLDKELDALGIKDFEKHMKELAFIWLDRKECPDLYNDLFEYMVDSGIYGKGENGIWGQLAKETMNKDKNLKLSYYLPSLSFMQERYKWLRKVPALLPIAWIIRGITAFNSKESKEHKKVFSDTNKEEKERMMRIYHAVNLSFRK